MAHPWRSTFKYTVGKDGEAIITKLGIDVLADLIADQYVYTEFFIKISLSLARERCRAVDLVDEEMPLDKEKKVIFVINLDLLKERT
jgi:hypothetical protein